MPAVSVLMPIFNAMPYLPAAVESILTQSFADFELLALDDASTDGSTDYLAGLTDPRVRHLRLPKAGYVVNLNLGLMRAQAPLVARMDADDVSLPDRFAEQVRFFESHPQAVAVGCQAEIIDRAGAVTGPLKYDTADAIIRYRLLTDSHLPHPGTMIRTRAVKAAGGYDPAFEPAEDYDLWTRLTAAGTLHNLPRVHLHYRRHGANISATKEATLKEHRDAISDRHLTRSGFAADAAEAALFRAATTGDPAALTGPGAAAVKAVWGRFAAAGTDPATLRPWLRWFAAGRAEHVGRFSRTGLRWLRLARYIDPAAFGLSAVARKLLRR